MFERFRINNNDKGLSFWQLFVSTVRSFFGVQKSENRERDFKKGKPLQFILMGLFVTAILIFSILMLVKFIIAQAGV